MNRFLVTLVAVVLAALHVPAQSQITDRIAGVQTGLAVKAPVKVATSADITLSGEQTIGSTSVVAGDRVLVRAQSDATENGIYVASTSAWSRASDFDGNRDAANGTLVVVPRSTGQDYFYQLDATDPVVIGTSSLTFTLTNDPNVSYDITAQEVTAGLTSDDIDEGYEPGDIRRYGAAVDGATDDSAAIQAAIDVAEVDGGEVYVPFGITRAQGLEVDASDVRFLSDGWIQPVSDSAGSVISIGPNSTGTQSVENISGNLNIGPPTASTEYASMHGVSVYQSTLASLRLNVRGTVTGLRLIPGSGQFVSYNDFYVGQMSFCGDCVLIDPLHSTAYANENRFWGGRYRSVAAGNYIDITNGAGGSVPNSNVFYGPTFEGIGSIFSIDGQMNKIIAARYEPSSGSTQGGMVFGDNSVNNVVEFSYNPNLMTDTRRHVNHGAGTQVDVLTFTITGDLTDYFFPGQVTRFTVGGSTYTTAVKSSSYSAPDTTVRVMAPLVGGALTDVLTAKITNTGTGNKVYYGSQSSQSINVSYENRSYHHEARLTSTLYMTPISSAIPAVVLGPASSANDRVFQAQDFDSVTAHLNAAGHQYVTRFSVGDVTTPVATQAHVADPSGGGTQDAEARAAINEILDTLEAFGLHAGP